MLGVVYRYNALILLQCLWLSSSQDYIRCQ